MGDPFPVCVEDVTRIDVKAKGFGKDKDPMKTMKMTIKTLLILFLFCKKAKIGFKIFIF